MVKQRDPFFGGRDIGLTATAKLVPAIGQAHQASATKDGNEFGVGFGRTREP